MRKKMDSSSENVVKSHGTQQGKDTISKYLQRFRPNVVKRCFITGKQCIFTNLICESRSDRLCEQKTDKDLSVFVIIPFKANFETFYQWSLKPFLRSLGIDEANIRKADEIMDMGYIVCEKICKRIQQSDLIIADISVKNTNVFYELGLSYGLERPVMLIQKDNLGDENLLDDPRIVNSLSYNHPIQSFSRQKVFRYQGVEKLSETDISDYILTPPEKKTHQPMKTDKALKLSLLDFSIPQQTPPSKNITRKPSDDIQLDFQQIMIGAINAAMRQISDDLSSLNDVSSSDVDRTHRREWEQIKDLFDLSTFGPGGSHSNDDPQSSKEKNDDNTINPGDDEARTDRSSFNPDFYEIQTINIDGSQSFESITQQMESSFCTIVEVTPWADQSNLAYFWLGFCHSRGLNVIPVFKLKNKIELRESGNKLAFDVRSLWFADFYEDEPYTFTKRFQEILTHLFLRDLPDRQKRDFWKRFPPENELKVFTGAVHIQSLRREVVGDWDVRTVSELFSYLPSIRETALPTLITPFYSPEQAYKRNDERNVISDELEFVKKFNEGIDNQLKGSNAIIIASPDVNPVGEYFLTKIYQVSSNDQDYEPHIPFCEYVQPDFNGYILVKNRKKDDIDERAAELGVPEKSFPRLFFREEIDQKNAPVQKRGFIHHQGTTDGKKYLEDYYSQDDSGSIVNGERTFKLVAHLLIAKYPPEDDDGNFVILLNGVSGPATFALAQILTGAGIDPSNWDLNTHSEDMLFDINWRLNERPDAVGVEGLVEIEVVYNQDNNQSDPITNVDIRTVKSWKWYPNHPHTIFKKKTTIPKSSKTKKSRHDPVKY